MHAPPSAIAYAPTFYKEVKFMQKLYLYAALCVFCCWLLATPVQASPHPQAQAQHTDELWIDLGLQPELVDDFNGFAGPNDIARIDHISRFDMLEDVSEGKRLVVFKSIADAQALLPHIGDEFDIIGYNLEHGPSNDPAEQAAPVESVIRMRELADEFGKELALGPDREFAIQDGVAMAPFVDLFILQVQRVQTEPQTVREFVVPLAQQFRRVNPDVQISVQIRTEGDATQLHQLIASLRGSIDGISILTSPETVDFAEELLEEFRPGAASTLSPTPAKTAAPGQPAQSPANPTGTPIETPERVIPLLQKLMSTPTGSPERTQGVTNTAPLERVASSEQRTRIEPAEPAATAQPESRQHWKTFSLVAIGCLGGGLLIAGTVYVYERFSSR